jgi:hypothetical protein
MKSDVSGVYYKFSNLNFDQNKTKIMDTLCESLPALLRSFAALSP